MPHQQLNSNNSKPTKTDKRASFMVTAHNDRRPNSGNGSDSSDSNKPSSGDDSKNGKTTESTTTGTGGTSDTMTSQVKGKFLPSSYKIKWCRTQLETGYCPYEVKCMFAHTQSELRTRFQNVEDGITTEEAVRSILRDRVVLHRRALKSAAAEADAEQQGAKKPTPSTKQSNLAENKKNSSDDSSSIGSLNFGQLAEDCGEHDSADDEVNKHQILSMGPHRNQQEADRKRKKKKSVKGMGFDKHSPKYYLNPDLPLGPAEDKGGNSKSLTRNLNAVNKTSTQPVSIRVGAGSGLPPPKAKKTYPATNDGSSSPGAEGNGSGNGVSGKGQSGNANSGTSHSSSSGKQILAPSSTPAKPNGRSAPSADAAFGFGTTAGLMPAPMMFASQQQQYMAVMMVPTPMFPTYPHQQPAMMAPTAAAGQAATPQGFVPIGVPQPYFFAGGAPTPSGTTPMGNTVYGTAAGAAASQPMYIQTAQPTMYSLTPMQHLQYPQ